MNKDGNEVAHVNRDVSYFHDHFPFYYSYTMGITNTAKALDVVRTKSLLPSHGRRKGVDAIVIVITDGGATDAKKLPAAVKKLRKVASRIIAVGIGSQVNEKQLALIGGGKQNVISTKSYAGLKKKVKEVVSGSCGKYL